MGEGNETRANTLKKVCRQNYYYYIITIITGKMTNTYECI